MAFGSCDDERLSCRLCPSAFEYEQPSLLLQLSGRFQLTDSLLPTLKIVQTTEAPGFYEF